MSRKCKNWLTTLSEYVEETESPRHFWLWSGLFTIGAALQRRVWLPYGIDTIYPNLFVLCVAPPGWSRKGPPTGFAKDILEDIGIPVGIDSPTKRHLTKRLAALSETEHFFYANRRHPQAPLALISKELSSFLAVDPKGMVEAITDIYDNHKKWHYGTSEKGEDFIRNVCISCYFATTPKWMADNLPEGAIGGGFTSRFIMVTGDGRYKEVPIPPPLSPEIYRNLKLDLEQISHLVGPFQWGEGSKEFFSAWYKKIKPWAESAADDRLYSSFSRVHIQVIKTAMCLGIAKTNKLILEKKDLAKAISLLQSILDHASEALSSHGRSPLAISVDKVIRQVKAYRTIPINRLLKLNYRDLTKSMLFEVLENITTMGLIRTEFDERHQTTFVRWIGKEKPNGRI